ncbi:MAG: 6-carboxytetrahydropterin synthase [Acidobacteria bacterium]|nr:6-carboxytetrahydropterin synthase [Acidobacteriota bacterium]
MYEVHVSTMFPAAHALRNYYGKTEPIHGHNWRAKITIAGEKVDSMGLLIDFVPLQKEIARVIGRLDHQFLNEVPPFDTVNPSAENIAKYLLDEFAASVPPMQPEFTVNVSRVEVWETDNCSAVYLPK